MRRHPNGFVLSVLACALLACCLQLPPDAAAQGVADQARAARAAQVLQQWYEPEKGLWKTTSWWNSANALNALIDYSKRTGSREHLPVIANTFDRCKEFEVYSARLGTNRLIRNFLNPWYDDEGWWVLVWIDAFDLTGEERYLEMAKTIFTDMTKGWDEVCGGGVYWQKPRIGKHAITNGLFLQAAARLHQRCPGSAGGRTFLEWALATWSWLQSHRLISPAHLVENGLSDRCELQEGSYYTYNQGMVLGGMLDLAAITGDASLVTQAREIAGATLQRLVHPGGILREAAEPQLSGDSAQFKGIFMRNLARLYVVTGDPALADFIRKNADSIWNAARDVKTDQLGAGWAGPFDQGDAARQSSALDALNTALLLGAPRRAPPIPPAAARASSPLRVMTWAVGEGLTGAAPHWEKLSQRVRDTHPDVLALPELDGCNDEQLASAAAGWGHAYSILFHHAGATLGVTSRQPLIVLEKLGRDHGHGLIHCRTFGVDFLVCALSPIRVASQQKEAEEIVFRVRQLTRAGRECIVLGNLNALSPFDGSLYQPEALRCGRVGGWKGRWTPAEASWRHPDYSVVAAFLSASLVDLNERFAPKAADRVSVDGRVPSGFPPALMPGARVGAGGSRIDYILATPGLAATCRQCRIVTGNRYRSSSGHFPVIADFDPSAR